MVFVVSPAQSRNGSHATSHEEPAHSQLLALLHQQQRQLQRQEHQIHEMQLQQQALVGVYMGGQQNPREISYMEQNAHLAQQMLNSASSPPPVQHQMQPDNSILHQQQANSFAQHRQQQSDLDVLNQLLLQSASPSSFALQQTQPQFPMSPPRVFNSIRNEHDFGRETPPVYSPNMRAFSPGRRAESPTPSPNFGTPTFQPNLSSLPHAATFFAAPLSQPDQTYNSFQNNFGSLGNGDLAMLLQSQSEPLSQPYRSFGSNNDLASQMFNSGSLPSVQSAIPSHPNSIGVTDPSLQSAFDPNLLSVASAAFTGSAGAPPADEIEAGVKVLSLLKNRFGSLKVSLGMLTPTGAVSPPYSTAASPQRLSSMGSDTSTALFSSQRSDHSSPKKYGPGGSTEMSKAEYDRVLASVASAPAALKTESAGTDSVIRSSSDGRRRLSSSERRSANKSPVRKTSIASPLLVQSVQRAYGSPSLFASTRSVPDTRDISPDGSPASPPAEDSLSVHSLPSSHRNPSPSEPQRSRSSDSPLRQRRGASSKSPVRNREADAAEMARLESLAETEFERLRDSMRSDERAAAIQRERSREEVRRANRTIECAICMAEVIPGTEEAVKTPCNHKFHLSCLKSWLMIKNICPTCRQIVGGMPAKLERGPERASPPRQRVAEAISHNPYLESAIKSLDRGAFSSPGRSRDEEFEAVLRQTQSLRSQVQRESPNRKF